MLEENQEVVEMQEVGPKKRGRPKGSKKLQDKKKQSPKKRKQNSLTNPETYWEIEDILDERLNPDGFQEVLIKWQGWAAKYNSWEPVEHLNDDLKNVLARLQKEKEERKKKVPRCKQHKRIKKQKSPTPSPTLSDSPSPSLGPSRSPSPSAEFEKDSLYQIEDIRDKKVEKGKTYYLIKWKGFSEEFNTWEPRKNLVTPNIAALKKRINHEKKQNHKQDESHQIKVTIPLNLIRNAEMSSEKMDSEESITSENDGAGGDQMIEENQSFEDLEEEQSDESEGDDMKDEPWWDVGEFKKELKEKKAQMKLKQRMLDENIQMLKRGMSSEDILHNRLDMPENFNYEVDGRYYGPEDKSFYDHRIGNHRCNEDGQVEAFKVIATSKTDFSKAPIVFWCEIADAREKFALEAMEYLISLCHNIA